ncbi:ribosomal RNA small subunit methyltransferase, mitochondrial [Malania oleifera]|uniref:ribosomal RNA small subunit methyltransferase, mitochondrial n=1 Tax=Malania oleifera TaxID=397392 RepID=UPI0025ADD04A|nr:ribosomal RNA small subunit methyltransferase, mitochondrial [Malania oleifera]
MLRGHKSLQFCLTRFIIRRHSLHTRPGRRRVLRIDDGDEEEKFRKTKHNQEGYIHLNKNRGQHILTNPRVIDSIVRESYIRPTDTILEVGPGTGNLTLKLLEASRKVVAVEIDKRMAEVLGKRVAERGLENRLNVICKDALKTEFPQFDLVVANIPYGISSPLVAKLVFGENLFRSATLLLQKEFARRLLANPGDSEFNRLAVNVKLVAQVEFVMDVSKRDFLPCPKVDSSVVIIRPKAEVPDVDLYEWWAFTRTCFSKKNKTLGATFKQKKKVMELLRISEMAGSGEANGHGNELDEYNEGGDLDENDREEDGVVSSSGLGMNVHLFREKIIGVLRAGGFEDKRPSKLSNEELLHLLGMFNEAGIRFQDQAKLEDKGSTKFAASHCS